MNILHLEASPGWGGQEMRILREAEGMRDRGHQLFFGVMKGAALGRHARAAGFEVTELNFNKIGWIGTLFQLLILMRKVDIVNTHSSLDSWIGGIAARIAGKKIVRTRHLSTRVKPGWNSRMIYGKLADFVVTTCESIIEPLYEQSKKPRELFRSVATGVDPEKIIPGDPGPKKDSFRVGMVCFMRSWKGIEDFMKAAQRLKGENIQWVIIGGGHEATYRKMAQDMNVDVEFTGHLDNPYPAIASLDVFALLSTANEGVSQAILQAAYLQRPLIATATGGLGEVCLDGKTGILVPPFDGKAVADAVLRLKGDPVLRQTYGENGRKLVLERFTFRRTLDEMEKIFQKVLE